ncbi:non-ribosomal peptide synthetase [Granulicella arctica]|uniref:non-ribosomal peptide synthetase n=1 Tax=Granulicella arctica TaxID=940613 RepID=UPI0021DF80BB|nr:non-ribosomal peptide synthetase [Granulicella arctica]
MRYISELISTRAADISRTRALQSADQSCSYAQLDGMSEKLASYLITTGLDGGDAVAIAYPRSFDQITAALAVMRAGGVYIPIDPSWPTERILHILSDSGAKILIAPSGFIQSSTYAGTLLDLQVSASSIAAAPSSPLPAITPETLAYVIYTSGSTGVPKGVEITHANLMHLIDWHIKTFGVTDHDRASHLAGLGFDASVWEVWPYLAAGACVVLSDDMVRTSPRLLQEWLIAEQVTIAFVPTPLAEPMMIEPWPSETPLRFLLTGGDTLHTAPLAGQPFTVVNNYGPTECTVVATSGVVPSSLKGVPSIGTAITGTTIYILDEHGSVVPIGETGELVIGGGGVGRGYRNQAALTARCFVPDPFSSVPGSSLYKTGDRAAILANGEILFQGRMDGQEKIRGQRLELDEITCILNRHEAVAFSVVAASGTGEDKHLVAYILPVDVERSVLSARDLQDFLSQSLPAFMVPSKFVKLERIPLTSNGKVDSSLLPTISDGSLFPAEASRAPQSPIEETILSIVRALLQNDEVGVDDDFFLVGGHSLMGTRLVMRVREAFGVNLMLRDLFEAGTVEQLASHVEMMLIAELDSMSEEEALRQGAN